MLMIWWTLLLEIQRQASLPVFPQWFTPGLSGRRCRVANCCSFVVSSELTRCCSTFLAALQDGRSLYFLRRTQWSPSCTRVYSSSRRLRLLLQLQMIEFEPSQKQWFKVVPSQQLVRQFVVAVARWSASAKLRRGRLLFGWATRYQPSRSTQPGHPSVGRRNEYQRKLG